MRSIQPELFCMKKMTVSWKPSCDCKSLKDVDEKNPNNNQSEIILYQAPDNQTVLEMRFEGETIWLTQAQIVTLYSTSKANVSEHIKQIYQSKELEVEATVRNFRTVQRKS